MIAKTYEGLASQIQKLNNDEISIELRNKLIENTLNASSDNPSKYITNYNKCDNPITEILNNKNFLNIIKSDDFDTYLERFKNICNALFSKSKNENNKTLFPDNKNV